MRITTSMIYSQSLNNLNQQSEQYFYQNKLVSSGKKINSPSDDPVGMVKVLGLRTLGKSLDQYQKNIDNGTSRLRYTDSALMSVEQILTDSKVLAEQMATGTYNEDQRRVLSVQAGQLFDQMMEVGNTKVVDKYIFSGFKTDTKTFTRDENYNISYHGDDNNIQLSINQSTKVTVNTTGQRTFIKDLNVFDVLKDLRLALDENSQDGVQQSLEALDDAMQQVVEQLAIVGTSLQQMETAKSMNENLGFNTDALLSDTEDTDMLEAVTALEERKLIFQATLQSTSMISGLTLVNYI